MDDSYTVKVYDPSDEHTPDQPEAAIEYATGHAVYWVHRVSKARS